MIFGRTHQRATAVWGGPGQLMVFSLAQLLSIHALFFLTSQLLNTGLAGWRARKQVASVKLLNFPIMILTPSLTFTVNQSKSKQKLLRTREDAKLILENQFDRHCLMNVCLLKSQNRTAFATTYGRRLCITVIYIVHF